MTRRLDVDDWVRISEAARMVGEPIEKFRDRMYALDAHHGGRLLRNFGNGKKKRRLFVSLQALQALLKTDPNAEDQERQQLLARVDELARKLQVVRDAHRTLRASVFRKLERLEAQLLCLGRERTRARASRDSG